MKLAFLSDIHGNSIALKAVLHDIQKLNVDKIMVLGDLCYRGIQPKESLELVKGLDAEVIKGNADEWIVRGVLEGEVPVDALDMMNTEREWGVSKLTQNDIEYLRSLPTELRLEFSGTRIHAFHATPNDLFDVVQPFESDQTLREKLVKSDSDIYIYAHIHKAFVRYINGKCFINTGSVGLPFDGLGKASYALVELGEDEFEVSIRRVNYNIEDVLNQLRNSDYPNKTLLNSLLKRSSNG
ncbi:metallophosphoesterase family protein [Ornithinibacillus californiensis]|uniref:metallophosphoesterase family protein n=1 Tax=Ornithinibacillus californiensis TaxID=161536 RepID=UPI00064DB1EB|nr:metallophosphoesterase family protein [Ornithinibacillus californiensis]